jgi:hypothetical protein
MIQESLESKGDEMETIKWGYMWEETDVRVSKSTIKMEPSTAPMERTLPTDVGVTMMMKDIKPEEEKRIAVGVLW